MAKNYLINNGYALVKGVIARGEHGHIPVRDAAAGTGTDVADIDNGKIVWFPAESTSRVHKEGWIQIVDENKNLVVQTDSGENWVMDDHIDPVAITPPPPPPTNILKKMKIHSIIVEYEDLQD